MSRVNYVHLLLYANTVLIMYYCRDNEHGPSLDVIITQYETDNKLFHRYLVF